MRQIKYFTFAVFLSVAGILVSCADFNSSIGRNQITPPLDGKFYDTVLVATRDSCFRNSGSIMTNGNLHFGYYRGMNASSAIRFDNFDSLALDTVLYDSVRVEQVWLSLHPIRESFGLLADNVTTPIPLEFWQPTVYSQYFDLSRDSLERNSTRLPGTVTLPGDTTGVDSLRLDFPGTMLPTVQKWVSIKTQSLTDTNFGLWLRPDTISSFSIRSFHSNNDAIDSLRPRLMIVYSRMSNGSPIGLADTFAVKSTSTRTLADAAFISPGNTPLTGLQVGSGDAIRGLLWFDFSNLKQQQVIIHRAKLILTRNRGVNDFGKIEALYHYLPYNDSTSWQSTPTLSSAYLPSAAAVSDSAVEIDLRYAASYWLRKEYTTVAFVLLDSWEGINVSRTTFGSVTGGGTPPRIQLTLSRLEQQ